MATDASSDPPQLPSEWVAGASTYYRLSHEGKPYAILVGRTINDRECSFAVRWDPSSRNHFFTNLSTREKVWQLPEEVPTKTTQPSAETASRDGFRQRVAAIYRQYCPDKQHQVDLVLAEYGPGKEEACISALVKKYGPEPPAATAGGGGTSRPTGTSTGTLSAATPQGEEIAAYTKRVRRFYEVYCPSKIDSASKQLMRYQGQEGALIEALIKKYGPEPEATPAETSSSTTAPASTTTSPLPSSTPPEKQLPSDNERRGAGSPAAPAVAPAAGMTTSRSNQALPTADGSASGADDPPTSPRSTRKPSLAAAAAAVTNAVRSQSSSSVALMEADNRERILVSFVQDREQRLAEAHQRYEVSAQALESLRKTNRDLVHEMESLRRSTDKQISGSRLAMDQLREETQVSRNEWHRERQQLQSAVDDAAENSSKLLQHERLRLEEQAVKFIGEKAQLQADLHKAKQELDEQMQRSADLIAVLDKRDKEHQRLLRHIDDLNRKIEGIARSTRSTQTDLMDTVKPVPEMLASHAGGTVVQVHDTRSVSYEAGARADAPPAVGHDSTLSAIEEFDRVMSTDKYRRAELETWKVKCTKLEKELHTIREQGGFPVSANGGGFPCDCTSKLKSMRATIGALRNSNRALESKIAELELRLVAQPPAQQPVHALSPHDEVGSDVGRLREAARLLKHQLEESQTQSRSQRKEIQELRGQLVRYMSASPNAARR